MRVLARLEGRRRLWDLGEFELLFEVYESSGSNPLKLYVINCIAFAFFEKKNYFVLFDES